MTNNYTPKQSVLDKLHKKSISAKDIATQFWCEKQMELGCLYGVKYTSAIGKGSAIHQQLQVEVYKALEVEPESWADRMYKTAYENIMTIRTLAEKGMARELKVYGSINGYTVVGQIDEMRMTDGKVTIVENKTTKSANFTEAYTKPHFIQAMLYWKLLQDLRSGSYQFTNFDYYYKTSTLNLSTKFLAGLKEIGLKEDMLTVKAAYERMFQAICNMPELSNSLIIHYVDRNTKEQVAEMTIPYDSSALSKDLTYAMGYWNGEREAQPVPKEEMWKCKICSFYGNKCTTWFNQ